ncbi:NUDIX domain-containing protein [Micromonospora sp. WMMD558]|uniref:NUDIX domain-containing protein n=1 Tax=unclassified Micromonospora TaxID=2617518 RepID=UPI0012B46B71|nr:NUDIX hydrolase [Micromonospora sp. WMMC415]QGN50486.1 NUDIX domain-containing protein [Micromonospora sp. WMMC415]
MRDDRPLYERDPEAWRVHLAEGNAKQPRKRVGADVLIRNEQGEILLVNPRYKPDWDLPGGMAEANEPPHEAAERELREELGLDLRIRTMLVVDWVAPHGAWDDSLMFIFDGGVLNNRQLAALRPMDDELLACKFYPLGAARGLLRPYVHNRLTQALLAAQAAAPRYLLNGTDPSNR